MCHQTVGLIARQLEAAGISTVTLTSARDITESVNPPRAVFLDYPLGHTSGRVDEPDLNRKIIESALAALSNDEPGTIVDLPHRWAETDRWKGFASRVGQASSDSGESNDDRGQRFDTPQYQTAADAEAAMVAHDGRTCPVCEGIDF